MRTSPSRHENRRDQHLRPVSDVGVCACVAAWQLGIFSHTRSCRCRCQSRSTFQTSPSRAHSVSQDEHASSASEAPAHTYRLHSSTPWWAQLEAKHRLTIESAFMISNGVRTMGCEGWDRQRITFDAVQRQETGDGTMRRCDATAKAEGYRGR